MLAAFVSPHGFGHSARVAAVVAELHRHLPGLELELYTTAPGWFFADSLPLDFVQHPEPTDVGLVQRDALVADPAATVAALEALIPPRRERLGVLARRLEIAGVRAVLCDVSALGIAVARRAGLPAVLLENFTWDWIYRRLDDPPPRLLELADELEELYAGASLRLQCEPICQVLDGAGAVAPIARRQRSDRSAVRAALGVPDDAALVVLSMGGIEWHQERVELPEEAAGREVFVVTLGGEETLDGEARRGGRRIALPHRSGFHHPDLVAAADAVVGKLGYSTVAEVAAAGVPLGYVTRPGFPESAVLEAWVRERLVCREVDEKALRRGELAADVAALLALDRRPPLATDGAAAVAGVLAPLLAPGAVR